MITIGYSLSAGNTGAYVLGFIGVFTIFLVTRNLKTFHHMSFAILIFYFGVTTLAVLSDIENSTKSIFAGYLMLLSGLCFVASMVFLIARIFSKPKDLPGT